MAKKDAHPARMEPENTLPEATGRIFCKENDPIQCRSISIILELLRKLSANDTMISVEVYMIDSFEIRFISSLPGKRERSFHMKHINVMGNRDLIEYFKKDPNILLAAVFGSFVENNFLEKISDIDIAILFENNITLMDEARIMDDLSGILKFEDIDLLNLNKANFLLRYNAVIKGRIIYEKDRKITEDFLESVLYSYRLHYYRYNSMQKEFIQNLNEDWKDEF
ncbi:MAG TPA: nucleotidyltransferase domain-containing protein [Thermoanaerobacterales bacterium]|nr:nucleotidyltransferase domain-containing protein [Thermoanaerobacterales bacterium]